MRVVAASNHGVNPDKAADAESGGVGGESEDAGNAGIARDVWGKSRKLCVLSEVAVVGKVGLSLRRGII